MIHRDLKPENVLIKPDGGVKVVDFGIAQIEGPEATRLTRAGAMLGTPAYMAPEQLLGEAVDGRADIYAWGIVLSEMLTGRHPLQGRGRDRNVHLTGPFATIIARCLHADPAARYASARDLVVGVGVRSPEAASTSAGGLRWCGADPRSARQPLLVGISRGGHGGRLLGDGVPRLVRPRADRRLAGTHVLHRAAGNGGRRGDRATAPLVHVALLSLGIGVGPSAIEPMDPRRRLGVRGDAGARWSAHRRRRLAAGHRPSL